MSDSSVIARWLLTTFAYTYEKLTEHIENVIGEKDANDQHVFEIENSFRILPKTPCDDVSGEVRPSVVNRGKKKNNKKVL